MHKTRKHLERGCPRSIEKMVALGTKAKKSKMKAADRQGQTSRPMLTQIPVGRVIADEMHLILRVFDRIFLKMKVHLGRLGQLTKLESEMGRILGRKVTISENLLLSTRLSLRDRERLLDNFNLGLPVEECGRKFMRLIRCIREMCRTGEHDGAELDSLCDEWRLHFLSACQDSDFTPYMHILCFHISDLVSGTDAFFHHFNQQLVEKANTELRENAERYQYAPRSLIVQHVKRGLVMP